MSEISRLKFININAYEFGQPVILAIYLKRSTYREHDIGLAPILVISSQQIRSYLRLSENSDLDFLKPRFHFSVFETIFL